MLKDTTDPDPYQPEQQNILRKASYSFLSFSVLPSLSHLHQLLQPVFQTGVSHFDTIVLAFGSKANQDLYQEIKGEHVHLIGDASKAGDAKKAIFESTQLALKL